MLLGAAALGWLAAGPAATRPVEAAAYDRFYANFQGEELMRVVNADRAALGLARLAADPVLERIARDRPLECPSDASLTIRGRARDMADRGYLSHTIKGCRDAAGNAFDTFDLLRAFGYTYALAGENVAWNSYSSSAVTYATGCDSGGGGCHGDVTGVPSSVAVAERFFMGSSVHRGAILSTSYDHFGCAAWNAANGNHYYACYFVRSGSGGTDTTGPAISNLSGSGATYAVGSTPTFTATATDAASLISDGYAAIDGSHIRSWAEDHAGLSVSLSAKAPPLAAGTHTFTWWVRDASSMLRQVSFLFNVEGAAAPTASPRKTTSPTKAPTAPPPTTAPATAPPTAAPAILVPTVAVSTAHPAGDSPAPSIEPGDGPIPSPSTPMPAAAAGGTGDGRTAGTIDGSSSAGEGASTPNRAYPSIAGSAGARALDPARLAAGRAFAYLSWIPSLVAVLVTSGLASLLLARRALAMRPRRVSRHWFR